jgi:hypothetical protein
VERSGERGRWKEERNRVVIGGDGKKKEQREREMMKN